MCIYTLIYYLKKFRGGHCPQSINASVPVGGSATITGDVAANHRLTACKISYTLTEWV